MVTYVALLRGVNVGGVTVLMAPLAQALTAAGLQNVRTVLASGNVLLDANSAAEAHRALTRVLADEFGYSSWVLVLEQARVASLTAAFPFPTDDADWQPYVVFCESSGLVARILDEAGDLDPGVDRVAAGDGVIYWTVRKGKTLSSPFGKLMGRKSLASTTTTRNTRTLEKLL